jgi:hypothetical protein
MGVGRIGKEFDEGAVKLEGSDDGRGQQNGDRVSAPPVTRYEAGNQK